MEYIERYEELVSDMWDELEGAKKYAKEATRGEHSTMQELARQEYNHFIVLHTQTLELIKHVPVGDALHHVWRHDQQRLMEHAAKVKGLLDAMK